MRLHPAGRDRLDSLASYDVLGTGPEPELDAVTALLAELFDVPLAAVSLIDADQQWFTSLHGADLRTAPRLLADAGCAWAQGWLFSAAVPGAALPEVLARLAAQAVALPDCTARVC